MASPVDLAASAAVLAAGIVMVTRFSSWLRVLLGLELMASGAAAGLVLAAGRPGAYYAVAVVDTVAAAVAAALAVVAARRRGAGTIDELRGERG